MPGKPSLQELLKHSAALHDHLCPRQVLGVRMGMLAGQLLGLDLPQTNKRLLIFVETDGCFADGVAAATGCTLGHRTLRLIDYGKVAAVFVDTRTEAAFRIAPGPAIRQMAREIVPEARSRWHAQLEAYQTLSDADLLITQPVALTLSITEIVSKPGIRVNCAVCGEEIINQREILRDGLTLCQGCAGPSYYLPAGEAASIGECAHV